MARPAVLQLHVPGAGGGPGARWGLPTPCADMNGGERVVFLILLWLLGAPLGLILILFLVGVGR